MSQPAPKRRGRPARKVPQTEEERLASQRARSQRYYQRQHKQAVVSYCAPTESQQAEFIHHYQPHPPAIPSTTDPVVGLHLEPHLQIPTPFEVPLPAESTYNRDYDEPSETEAGPAAAPCNPPVWNHDENSRTNHTSPVGAQDHHPLFENSQAQLELISQGCDAADAAFIQDQPSPLQLEARDEELQALVDTVQQLLITPDRETTRGKKDLERILQFTIGTIYSLTRFTRGDQPTTILKHDGITGRSSGVEPSICRFCWRLSHL